MKCLFINTKLLRPKAPQNVTGVINSDGSITVDFEQVDGAKAYIVHYGGANQSDPHDAIFMGYTETLTWNLGVGDVPALEVGDKIYLYVQSYREVGEGSSDIEKAAYLNSGPFTGSSWSDPAILEKK